MKALHLLSLLVSSVSVCFILTNSKGLDISAVTFPLCEGLGIDDMFALVASMENLTEEEMLLPLQDKMGLVLPFIEYCLLFAQKNPLKTLP